MNPQLPKIYTTVSIVVTIISLTMNLILFLDLRQSNHQAAKWKTAHERIAREQLQLKKQLKNQLSLPPQKGEDSTPTPPHFAKGSACRVRG